MLGWPVTVADANDLYNALARYVNFHSQFEQRVSRNSIRVEQSKQQVLGSDVLMLEGSRLGRGELESAFRAVSEASQVTIDSARNGRPHQVIRVSDDLVHTLVAEPDAQGNLPHGAAAGVKAADRLAESALFLIDFAPKVDDPVVDFLGERQQVWVQRHRVYPTRQSEHVQCPRWPDHTGRLEQIEVKTGTIR